MRARTHKYGAVRTGGYSSKLEARRAAELRLLQAAGEIADLREQVVLEVQPQGCDRITLRVDFQYRENGLIVADDAKGIMNPDFAIKWKLAKAKYPTWLFRLSYGNGRNGFTLKDTPPREVTS